MDGNAKRWGRLTLIVCALAALAGEGPALGAEQDFRRKEPRKNSANASLPLRTLHGGVRERPKPAPSGPVTSRPASYKAAPKQNVIGDPQIRLASAESGKASAPPQANAPLILKRPEENSTAKRQILAPISANKSQLMAIGGAAFIVLVTVGWGVQKLFSTGAKSIPTGAVQVYGRLPLNTRQYMQVIRFGNKVILLAVSPTGCDCLAEIDDPQEIARIAMIFRGENYLETPKTFAEALRAAGGKPVPAKQGTARG